MPLLKTKFTNLKIIYEFSLERHRSIATSLGISELMGIPSDDF